jgi:hypothetical protein
MDSADSRATSDETFRRDHCNYTLKRNVSGKALAAGAQSLRPGADKGTHLFPCPVLFARAEGWPQFVMQWFAPRSAALTSESH